MTDKEAFTLALALALSAPTDELSEECTVYALEIGRDLSDAEVEECKAAALVMVELSDLADLAEMN